MTIMATRFNAKSVLRAALAALAVLWLSSSPVAAESAKSWSIADMSGRVNIVRTGAAPVALTAGDELRPGDMIETTADSTVTLIRAGESIRIAPNSRMGLPADKSNAFATLIMQQLGTLLFKVEKQQQPHFEVKTPFLAAVVKGTTFAVSVSSSGASVHVVEGAVQVGDLIGNKGIVRPGQTATVSSAPGGTLSIKGGSATSPAQRADAGTGDVIAPTGSDLSDASPAKSTTASLDESQIESDGFVITEVIGSTEIDISAASDGLIQAVQIPGDAGAIGSSGVMGSPLVTTVAATAGGTTSSISSGASSPLSSGGSAGGSLGGVVTGTTSSLGGVVAGTTSSLGGIVAGTTSSLGGIVAPVTGGLLPEAPTSGGLLGGLLK